MFGRYSRSTVRYSFARTIARGKIRPNEIEPRLFQEGQDTLCPEERKHGAVSAKVDPAVGKDHPSMLVLRVVVAQRSCFLKSRFVSRLVAAEI
jgi:hypothetical protein